MNGVLDQQPLNVQLNNSWISTTSLGEARVQQRLGLPTQCELTFLNPPGPLDDLAATQPGTGLRLDVGGQTLFSGDVTAVEHIYGPTNQQEIRLRAYDRLDAMRKMQAVRAFTNMNANGLARELAKGVGLKVQAGKSFYSWPFLLQLHQSDLDLLAEVAALDGLYPTVRGETLHLISLSEEGQVLTLDLGVNLLEARIEFNDNAARSAVQMLSWDPLQAKSYRVSQSPRRIGPSRGVQRGFAELVLPNMSAPEIGRAQVLAQAEADRRAFSTVTFWGVARGDAALMPGVSVEVTGVNRRLEDRYVLTEVTHVVDGRFGYISEINTNLPQIPIQKRSPITTLGIVTKIDGDKGRMRVGLPAFGEVESDWLPVLTPGAGNGKGLIALSDVDDKVLVLFTNVTTGQGVVLGGLYGGAAPPDDGGVSGGQVRRYTVVTPRGQKFQMDDDGNVIRLENRAGSYIELAGADIVIAGKSVDFRSR